MKTGAIIGVFLAAVILAVLFAIAGAGIYGSPFAGSTSGESRTYAKAILVGPLASFLALAFHKRLPDLAGLMLVVGALVGVYVGLLVKSDFREFWGKVFAVLVWLPMAVVGIRLLILTHKSKN